MQVRAPHFPIFDYTQRSGLLTLCVMYARFLLLAPGLFYSDDPLAALMAPTPRASVPTAGFGSTAMPPPNLRSQSMPNFAVFSPRGGAGGANGGAGGAKRMEPVHEGVVLSGASAPKAGIGNGTGRPGLAPPASAPRARAGTMPRAPAQHPPSSMPKQGAKKPLV